MKKVLVLCTGNSCRSIIAEALINARLEGILASSAGVSASGEVHPYAKKVLKKHKIWRESYYSKNLDSMVEKYYDLVITVCDHAKKTCPIFPKAFQVIHIGFEDPDGLEYNAFEATLKEIEEKLLPKIQERLL